MDPAAAPALPREAVPLPPAGDDFDPTNLPALKDPVKTPDDLKR